MKQATYRLQGGGSVTVDYDPDAPCRMCGLPVVEASVGGTDVCPWCDCGKYRDGCGWVWKASEKGLAPRFGAGPTGCANPHAMWPLVVNEGRTYSTGPNVEGAA